MFVNELYTARIELPTGSVNIYGFVHGVDGSKLPRKLKRRLDNKVGKIKPADYMIVEGSPFVPYPPKDSRIRSLAYALKQTPHLEQIEHVDDRTELPEWYLEPMIAPYSEILRTIKSGNRIPDVRPEKLTVFEEKVGIFRSLLMARVAYHRANALNGNVRLFLGSGHGRETRMFLEFPKSTDQYLTNADNELRGIYSANEFLQTSITRQFAEKSSGLRPEERPVVLRETMISEIQDFHMKYMNIKVIPV